MDMSTIGRSLDDFLKRCPQCNSEFYEYGRNPVIYSSCRHVVCRSCNGKSQETCPTCLKTKKYARNFCMGDLTMDMSTFGRCNCEYEFDLHDINARQPMIFSSCKHVVCLNCRVKSPKRCPVCRISNQSTSRFSIGQLIDVMNREGYRILTKEDQEKNELERTRYEDKIKELEMENNRSMQESLEKFEDEKLLLENQIKKFETEKLLTKGSFSCCECNFPVAEYRSHICVDCGISSGFLTKEDLNLRLNADTQQIEKENLMCVGCAIEGFHAGHQTVNYQQLKLEPISIEKKKAKDTELAEKRDTVVNSQTMITVARLLQTARVELSKLSEETVNAVTWDEFNSIWNSADIELARAHSITEIFLNVADDTEKSLEKVVAGLGAIRTGCKVFVKNSGKGDISEGANRAEIKTDCSASVITDASEWEALSDSSGKSDQKGEI